MDSYLISILMIIRRRCHRFTGLEAAGHISFLVSVAHVIASVISMPASVLATYI